MQRPLDFAIIGAQKASTTALAAYLNQSEDLYLPPKKETHFFKRQLAPEGPSHRNIAALDRFFKGAPDRALLGDATPIYLYWPYSLDLLKAHNPDIKLIISLRHPVLRAYSGWSMERRREREPLSFSDAIRAGRERVSSSPFGVHHVYSYVERGFYAEQLAKLFALFDEDQVFIMRSDQVVADDPKMRELCKFLGLDDIVFTPITQNIHQSSLRNDTFLTADFDYLQALYLDDLSSLKTMVNIDITDWIETTPKRPAEDFV
ncbi:MAG: sulfotransferase [Pseudomonadota bacterium]